MSITRGTVIPSPLSNYMLDKQALFEIGGRQMTYNTALFSSNIQGPSIGSQNVNFSISNSLGLVRTSMLRFYGKFTLGVVAGATAGPLITPGTIGLSSNPLYSIISNIVVSLGSYQCNFTNVNQVSDVLGLMCRSMVTDYGYNSGDAEMPDNCTNFNDLGLTQRDVLGKYQATTVAGDIQAPRSTRIWVSKAAAITAGTANSQQAIECTFDIYCPFRHTGMLYGSDVQRNCLVRVPQVNITINGTTASDQFISFNDHSTLSAAGALTPPGTAVTTPIGATGTIAPNPVVAPAKLNFNTATLELHYITVDLGDMNIPLQVYNSQTIMYNQQQVSVSADNIFYPGTKTAVIQIPINQLSFPQVPSHIVVWLTPQDSTLLGNTAPGWMGAFTDACSASFNLVNSSVCVIPAGHYRDLYQISRRNGLSQGLSDWSAGIVGASYTQTNTASTPIRLLGGPVILSPRDLQYSRTPAEAPGCSSNLSSGLTFSGQIQFAVPCAGNYSLNIMAIIPRIVVETSFGVFIEQSLNPAGMELETYHDSEVNVHKLLMSADYLTGGSFGSFFRNLGHKVKSGFDKFGHLVKKGADAVGTFAKDHEGLIEKGLSKGLQFIPGVGPELSSGLDTAYKYKDQIAKIASAVKNASGHGVQLPEDTIRELLGAGFSTDDIEELVEKVSENPDAYLDAGIISRNKMMESNHSRYLSMRDRLRTK